LKLQLAALADYRAVVAKHPNAHASAAIAGMEAAVGELRSQIDAQKSPEARLQAAMSRQAAAQKDYQATELEVQTLAQQLQDAMDLKDAQAAKLATLSAEVAELKLRTLPAPAPPAPPPALDLDALLQQLAQRGVAVPREVCTSRLLAVQPPAHPVVPTARAAAEAAAPPEAPVEPAATSPAVAGDGGEDAAMQLEEPDARGRKREADAPGRAAARPSKTPCPIADVSVHEMLLRAKGVPVTP
jgi:hypothetical protein